MIPEKVRDALEIIRSREKVYVEVKKIKGKYYVYRSTSEYDREKKKPVKKTEYMGRITPEGVFIPKRSKIQESSREIFEYGNCMLAYHFLKDVEDALKQLTPYSSEIIAFAIVKAVDPKPIRLLASRWEKFYLSQMMEANLNPKHVSRILRQLGEETTLWYELFSKLITDNDFLLYDLTAVSTCSSQKLAEKGYNADHEYTDQIGVVMAFSTKDRVPVAVEVYYGSMKDISTLKDFLNRYPQRRIGFIFDRGFSSYKLLEELRRENIHYIVPLRKNSRYISIGQGTFSYRSRPIRWSRKEIDLGYVYIYDDPSLRGDEETALLRKVDAGKLTMEEYEEKRKVAGIIGIISDLDLSGEEIFDLYKSREDVEIAFDAMKNYMDADRTYMHTAEAVRGYFFITFLAMRVYFSILKRLREEGLTNRISVNEALFELSKVTLIKERSGREYFAKIPKRAKRILSLFPEAMG